MHRLEMSLVVWMLLASGCAGTGAPRSADPGTPPAPVERQPTSIPASALVLSPESVLNAAYPLPEANGLLIQFTGGRYRGPVLAGDTEPVFYMLQERLGRGDLDGDGVEDVAVLMVREPAGDLPLCTLWAVINTGGTPDPRGVVLLGEKVQVGAPSISGLKIFVDVVRPGAQDVEGVPARRITESYKLLGSRLERADNFR